MKKTVFIFAAIMGLFVSMTACANKKANDMNAKANGTAQENGKTLVAQGREQGGGLLHAERDTIKHLHNFLK